MRDTKEMLEEKKRHKWFTGLHNSALRQIQTLQSDSWLNGVAFPAFEVTSSADTFVW